MQQKKYHDALFADNEFPSATLCKQCHPRQYREWSVSPLTPMLKLVPYLTLCMARSLSAPTGLTGISVSVVIPRWACTLKNHYLLLTRLRRVRIYGIAFTELMDDKLVQDITERTRGQSFVVLKAEELSGAFKQLTTVATAPQPNLTPLQQTPSPLQTPTSTRL